MFLIVLNHELLLLWLKFVLGKGESCLAYICYASILFQLGAGKVLNQVKCYNCSLSS